MLWRCAMRGIRSRSKLKLQWMMTNRPTPHTHTHTQCVGDSLSRGDALAPRLNYGWRSILKDSEDTKTTIWEVLSNQPSRRLLPKLYWTLYLVGVLWAQQQWRFSRVINSKQLPPYATEQFESQNNSQQIWYYYYKTRWQRPITHPNERKNENAVNTVLKGSPLEFVSVSMTF